jgi:benzoyl-CoA reductase/2-hydroxyglutaryl-CoA dehydratase subunit BcrC/BadD/HgdB
MKKIGITSTIPVEVIYAAGYIPEDLNNIFITSANPQEYITQAELDGYPRNACGWIKGLYSVALNGDYYAIIPVLEGDCSQTTAMVETLQMHGVKIIPFAYPFDKDVKLFSLYLNKLMQNLGTDYQHVMEWKKRLDKIRTKVWKIDELTWSKSAFSSFENHYYQVSCSDFEGNPDAFEAKVDEALSNAKPKENNHLRLGYIGVPPIFIDFYSYIEDLGVKIVFNETQRQFSMPFETKDLIEQYLLYTYPYDVFARIEDIKTEVKKRDIQGIIHYTQSFCFRQIQDMAIRKFLDIPILTIEGDSPMPLDARTRVRIESFVEMLS